jgi:ribose-phosphate pyrophosphokinase
MVRNLVLFSGSSHPQLTDTICTHLGIPPGQIHLSKFSVGETRVEIGDSVREKDVYIVQSGGGRVNDNLMELLITISACKTASAKRVTAVLPLFPYSRQSDIPYDKKGAPLARMPVKTGESKGDKYTFDSTPPTPGGSDLNSSGQLHKKLNGLSISKANGEIKAPKRKDTGDSIASDLSAAGITSESYFDDKNTEHTTTTSPPPGHVNTTSSPHHSHHHHEKPPDFRPQRGYRQWVAQAGTLVADLLTCAGADHIITMDLHDPQYQGFFDIPVDNLYGRHLLRQYIQHQILPSHGGADHCVIVSPDAGGAKRATNIADALGMDFALIHKVSRPAATDNGGGLYLVKQERRPTQAHDRQNASLLLVGHVANRTAILIDDLADTSNTITRAAKLLKKSGAHTVYALVTHGVFSGDACERINQSALDKVVVTNSVPQEENQRKCPKLEVLEVGKVFAEAIRRVHHGESISVLFQYD